MTMSFRRPVLVAGVFLLALFTGGAVFSAEGTPGNLPLIHSIKDAVARVNGKDITEEELRIAVNNVMPMKSFHSTVSDKRFSAIRKETLERLIDDKLIYSLAVSKKKDKVSKKEIDERLAMLKKRIRSEETLETVLKRSNMTMDGLKKDLKFNIIISRFRSEAVKRLQKEAKAHVTEKYLKNYYNTHLEKFKEPARLHLRGILIKVDPSASQRVWIKAKKQILDISSEATKGADFSGLAKKYSQSLSAPKGGEMGWTHEGSLLPDIEAAVVGLKVGEISKPVMTIYGFHVFKLEGRKPARQKKFSELNIDRLKKELISKDYNVGWEAWLKDLRKSGKVEYLKKI